MAYEIPGQLVTLRASTTFAALQYTAVVNTGQSLAAQPTAGGSIFGVIQNNPVEDEACTVMVTGITKMRAPASTVAAGDIVAVSTDGEAIALAGGYYAIGRVVAGSSGGAGRLLTVLLQSIGTT